jgi:hypothetical protein
MKISKGRLKQIIQEEMDNVENPGPYSKERKGFDKDLDGVPDGADKDPKDGSIQEQVTPENMMLAMEALAQILSNPVLAAGVASLLGKAMYDKLQAMAQKDAEVMAQRPELDEAEEV